ncbi:MAG: mRNA surveillance protein pelota [Euryarchaeota archaeon]|nr:mRNA surveillance protein pelota [Euryarchaeota archaeon]
MKIEEREKGEISVHIDNIDDLWYLKNVLRAGDLVFGTVYRKDEQSGDMKRAKKTARRRMRVGIVVEKVEFQEFSDRLRIVGKIRVGPEDVLGLYQAINLAPGDEISIIKERWSPEEKELLNEAVKNAERPQVYFLGLEHGLATIAALRAYGVQELVSLRKRGDDDDEFFGEVLSAITELRKDELPLIILGPGFYKDNFVRFAAGKLKNYTVLQASHGDMRGIYEVLKSSLHKILQDTRLSREEKLIDRLLEEISKEGLYAYGMEEVKNALNMGAVETLMVSDRKYREYESLIKLAHDSGAEIHIISTAHEKGKILENLGGVAAILRFRPAG